MLFTTHLFLFGFLPITLLGFWALRSTQLRLALLALASYVFYAWWDWRFLPLMFALDLHRLRRRAPDRTHRRPTLRRALLIVGAVDQPRRCSRSSSTRDSSSTPATASARVLGVGQPFPVLTLVLPIGISFYTFNSMSYTIDVYRGAIPRSATCCATRRSSRSSRT